MRERAEPTACPCRLLSCKGSGKLTKHGHFRGCSCPRCTGRRNKSTGQRAERMAHRSLGGATNWTPTDESGVVYDVSLKPQVKAGEQVPASFAKFVGGEWFRHALSQAERAIPIGVNAKAALYLCMEGGDAFIVIQDRKGGRK